MSIVTMITVLGMTIQVITAKSVSTGMVEPRPALLDPLGRSVLLLGAAVSGALLLLSPLLAQFMKTAVLPVGVAALFVVPMCFVSMGIGRFQGRLSYLAMAFMSDGMALVKFGSAIALLALGLGVTSLMVGLVVATTVTAIAGVLTSRKVGTVTSGAFDKETGRIFLGNLLFWSMLSIDVPFARFAFPESEAGTYAAAAVVAKAVLWLPAVVTQITFPRLARAVNDRESTAPLMLKALGMITALGLASVLAIRLLGPQLFKLLFGPEFAGAGEFAWMLALAMVPFTVVNLLVHHHYSREGWRFVAMVAATFVFEMVGLLVFGTSPERFAAVLVVVGGAALVALIPRGGWELLARRRFVDLSDTTQDC